VTLQDRTPSRLFTDLYHHRREIFSPLVERAQRAIDRPMPVRKRTRPVDQRISRSRLSESGEDGVLLYRNLQTPAASTAAEEEETPREDAVKREEVRDEEPQDGVQATEQEEGSPTDDLIGDYTQPEEERTPTRESARSPPVEHRSVPEPSPAAAVRPQTPPPQETHPIDEDAPLTPVATTGKRLSRARPMSGHRERLDEGAVLAEGDVSLKRAGSGEARAIRGPRGMFSPFSVYHFLTPSQAPEDHVQDRESSDRWI
jgi:hypothetical protein